MSRETLTHHGGGVHTERNGLPPRVDFGQIAQNVIAGGIFATDADAVRKNEDIYHEYIRYPLNKLEMPYGNGPAVIMYGEDVPEDISRVVRKNLVDATRLLVPTEQVMLYFHHRFYEGDVFASDSMIATVKDYHPHQADMGFGKLYDDAEINFRTEGVDRKVHDRRLFTWDEATAGHKLALEHPEVVLTVLTYQSVMQDYFQELRGEFEVLALQPDTPVTETHLEEFDKYARQWSLENFTTELVPAFALFNQQRKDATSSNSDDEIFDQQLFHDAVDFIIMNGAFRNWVTVPARVAHDRQTRTDRYFCPAIKAIKEQMHDGALLSKIYGLVQDKVHSGDEQILGYMDVIRNKLVDAPWVKITKKRKDSS
jgi:hypothetical protein